jgi:hypothetical protein
MSKLHRLAMLSAFLLLGTPGCKHNLQRPYVDAMIKTELVIRDDIEAGDYKPEAGSLTVLDEWKKANANADAALKAKGK